MPPDAPWAIQRSGVRLRCAWEPRRCDMRCVHWFLPEAMDMPHPSACNCAKSTRELLQESHTARCKVLENGQILGAENLLSA